ncbi:DNA circularization N-terminal domain-containing protein [Histophilus somni]|nr:DNA circularization N-terminal domain-containing protein [Histophilus somni]
MMGWTVPIRQASFKGVKFDVIAVDETFERAVAEHSYPFVNGADLEDLGLNKQTVKLQAVCFGEGYYTDYKKLLAVIQSEGADVLVHPVRGRMLNMLLLSANLRHDADNINYVTLDLTFAEATPMQPIFVFEHSLLSIIDRYLNLLEDFMNEVTDFWVSCMEVIAFSHHMKSRLLKQWSAIYGCYEQLAGMFGQNNASAKPSINVSIKEFTQQSTTTLTHCYKILQSTAEKRRFASRLGVKAEFNELMRDLGKACNIPRHLVNGQQQKITTAAQFFATRENPQRQINTHLSIQEVKNLDCALHLMSCSVLAKAGVEIIEQQAENLTPAEIEYICQQIRTQILHTLNLVRALQQLAKQDEKQSQSNNDIYATGYHVAERLRTMAGEIMQMAVVAINQKPPLMVREVRFDSCIQQVAFDFYGNYRRSTELLRLNPQLNQPNFIEQGTLLNAYVK